jgi:uncharacterized membrane protein
MKPKAKAAKGSKRTSSKESADTVNFRNAAAIRLCWAIAGLVSAFLAWGSLSGKYLPGCDASGDCALVLGSKWAYAFSVPVSILGLLVYASGLIALGKRELSCERRSAIAAISLLIVLSVAWFTILQVAVIGKLCPWCMGAHIAGVIGAVLALRNFEFSKIGALPIFASLAAVAVLAVAQRYSTPPAPLVHGSMATTTEATNSSPAPEPPRELALHGGEILLNLKDVPITGSPTAPYVLVSLFDYTCHVCRDLHGLLNQAYAVNSNKLAIVHLPNPLDAACNPSIKQTQQAHVNACEHAKIGLAVWQADKSKFDSFTDKFFIPPQPMSVEESKQLASGLVGGANLESKLNNQWSADLLGKASKVYKANNDKTRSSKMPQIILGPKIYAGIFRADQLNAALVEAGLQPISPGSAGAPH